MQSACEAGDVLALLEGASGGARRAADTLAALFAAAREPWLVRALLLYHARTASARTLELLARAPEPHARHLLDALLEQLRAPERPPRHHALDALAQLVARRPAWLHLLPAHGAARELLRAARLEREPVPLLHALLALAQLVPAAPALAAAHAADLADAAARVGGGADPHAALAARALFRAVYATHPCTAVEALRGSGAEAGAGAARDAWERAVAALAAGVRLHPALVTGSRAREADAPARVRPLDALLPARATPEPAPQEPPRLWRHSPAPQHAPGSTAQVARATAALRPGGDGWFALGERSGAESAPHTPLPAEPDAAEPEPAVEATPENTPARPAFRFPSEGGAARAIGRPSPAGSGGAPGGADGYAARLQRVADERRANDSPVSFGGAPPAAAARPEPRAPPSDEDREVWWLTARAAPLEWDPRAELPPPRPPPAPRAPPRRPPSAPPMTRARSDAAVQTVDTWPEPYDFLLADFYRAAPDDVSDQTGESTERLDAYLAELYSGGSGGSGGGGGGGGSGGSGGELGEQLALAHAQLMYERWRREAHAERNRRLLGRCRRLHALELHNAALQERVRDLTRERDCLRARAAAPPRAAPRPEGGAREAALEAELERERGARARAEAGAREADAARARDAAELQRTRAEGFEAARHVELLARAALAAERRAEHVRRLRRELLVLGEREARLRAAAQAGGAAARAGPAGADEAALRAAVARAEAAAAEAGARAELAAARAHELEGAAGARDAAVAELKRATRLAAEEGAARARALQDKCAALHAIVRAGEARRLETLAAAR